MADFSSEAILKFEKMLKSDPQSQVFAPLAEHYLNSGRLIEGFQLAQNGVRHHPQFASGWIVLGKILRAQKKYALSCDAFEKAIRITPENLMALQSYGDTLLEEKKPKEALKIYKRILFYYPLSERARKIVEKLESVTADEYDSELFEMKPLASAQFKAQSNTDSLSAANTQLKSHSIASAAAAESASKTKTEEKLNSQLTRMLSLIDAFLVRNDLHQARKLIDESDVEFGPHPELTKRSILLQKRNSSNLGSGYESPTQMSPLVDREEQIRLKKVQTLKAVLGTIQRIKDENSTSSL